MISAVFLAGPKVYIYVDYYFGNLQIDYVCRASIQHILQQQNIEINPREFKRHESFWVDVYKSTCELKSKVTASYIKCIFERNFPSAQAQLWICRKGYKVHHLFLGGCRLPFCSQVTLVVCGCWMQNEIARDCLALSLSLCSPMVLAQTLDVFTAILGQPLIVGGRCISQAIREAQNSQSHWRGHLISDY